MLRLLTPIAAVTVVPHNLRLMVVCRRQVRSVRAQVRSVAGALRPGVVHEQLGRLAPLHPARCLHGCRFSHHLPVIHAKLLTLPGRVLITVRSMCPWSQTTATSSIWRLDP